MDVLRREIEALKPSVREILMSPKCFDTVKKRILFIYLLDSLGLAYHFEDEIEESLRAGFEKIEEMIDGENDLYTVSTIFWVLRTYGYNISSEIFKRFKEDNGKFKECLTKDLKGMLSLYEASHLGTTVDYIMDEASSFSSKKLASLAEDEMCPSHLSRRIQNVLSLSQHWNMEINVVVEYIPFYEQEVGHDEMLLKFAKLNLNLMQLHFLQELEFLTKWYKDCDFASNLPRYYREVIVEMHYLSLAKFFQPELSGARIRQTKIYIALMILDDTCDRYATIPEVESLVNSLGRWGPDDAMDSHPDFLKFVFNFIVDAFEECEREMVPQGRSYSVAETKEELNRFAKSNLDLAKLTAESHVPSFEEYMEIGKEETGPYITLACTLMGMDDLDVVEAYAWLKSRPQLLQSYAEMARLQNDMTGFKDDMKRGCISTGMNCYIEQYGVTEKEAFRDYERMITNAKKVINEEFLKTTDVPRRVMKSAFDCARSYCVSYSGGDGVTYPKGLLTKYFMSLYLNKI